MMFQDHRTSGSGEEDFERFLPYLGVTAILVILYNLSVPFPRRL